MVDRKLFSQALKQGNQNLIQTMLPHVTLKQRDIIKILKTNMKWQHDFLLKILFLKKYIRNQQDLNDLLFYAIHYKYAKGVRWALKKGANPNSIFRSTHCLAYASRYGTIDIVKLLLEHGSNPNPENDPQATPMCMAVAKLDMDLINLLQSYGAVMTKQNLQVALTEAARTDRFELVDEFLLKGAKIEDATYYNISYSKRTSIPKLLIRDFTFNLRFHPRYNAFNVAASLGNLITLKEFIKHGRHRTNEEDLPEILSTAMVMAAEKGKIHIVNYLLSQGADMNFTLNEQTALDKAIAGNHFILVKILNKMGAKSNKNKRG